MPTAQEFAESFYKRHPKLRRYAPAKVLDKATGSSSGHGEARQHGSEIWLFPKFWALPADVQDFVLAHEIGHYVLSEYGLSKFTQEAEAAGVDVWDNLPFGQFNKDEAFADAFATYFLSPSELRNRYPEWVSLVEGVAKTASMNPSLPVLPSGACPFCGAQMVSTCRCMRSDMTCANGHSWHHKGTEIHAGESDHGNPVCCEGAIVARVASSHKVVARFVQAELLTKSWLMGVRRGWLSLLNPPINDWGDVFKAFDKLRKFAINLQEEVRYTRRALSSSLPATFEEEGKKLDALFKQLQEAIKEKQSAARHWYDCATDNVPHPMESLRADGERMLTLYRTKFEELLDTQVKTRVDFSKGRYNPTRTAPITEVLDKILDLLRADAKEIEKSRAIDPEGTEQEHGSVYTEFDLYGMKVVVDDRTVTPKQIKQYVKFFDEAYHRLKAKRLDRIWYGTIFVRCENCGGVNQYGAELGVGGDYPVGQDVVNVYSRPSDFIVKLMAHELGHRYWFKLMGEGQRARFESLIAVDSSSNLVPNLRRALTALTNLTNDVDHLLVEFERKIRGESPIRQEALVESLLRDIHPYIFGTEFSKTLGKAFSVEDQKLWGDAWTGADASVEVRVRRHFLAKNWGELSKVLVALKEGTLPEWVDEGRKLIREQQDLLERFIKKKFEEVKDRQVKPVSTYGGKDIAEAFAEVFAHYVLEKDMDRDQVESFRSVLKTAAAKPPSKSQIDYAKHLLKQVGAEEPDWDRLDGVEVSTLIDDLKKKRGKPVWYGNGQFSHWEKKAENIVLTTQGTSWGHARMTTRVAARFKEKKKVKNKDGEERTVYIYSDRQVALRNAEKAKQVEKLKTSIDKLRAKVKKDLRSDDPEKKLTALAVALMDHTYERVGNDNSAEERGHFGVTGWQRGHLSFGKGGVTISYTGKSGVRHKKKVTDASIKKALRDAYEAVDGDDACIFEWDGGKVSAEKVNAYLEPFDITAKDIRGFHANREMATQLKAIRKSGGELPTDKKEREKLLKDEFKQALEKTAEAVGHEAATLRKQYLVPGLEEQYTKDGTILDKVASGAGTTEDEHWMLAHSVIFRYLAQR